MAKLCECGCGGKVKAGRRFIRGHHLRVRPQAEKTELTPELAKEMTKPLKVYLYPSFEGEDKGDGGIRHVVEAQIKHLPKFGIEIVKNPSEADVIAAHATIPPNFVNLYSDKTIVAMCHGLYWQEYDWGNWALKANADVTELNKIADVITAPTEWVANNIRRHTSRPVIVIPHGIDPEDWEPGEPRDYVLWNKTRPDPVCDPAPMNQVAAMLPEVFFVSTFGEEADNVKITGKLDFAVAKEMIKSASIYLCTTRETFGIGTLEAMACGVPVVGFNWGGQAEFLDAGNSILVTPGDIPALANAIKDAMANHGYFSEASRARALEFTWEKACEQYAQLFRETYEKRKAARPRTSIIVTNYNLQDYLENCLDSVLAQTDPDWECVIVDDFSSDRTGVLIATEYAKKDSRFKVVMNQENVYLAEARNIGIRTATGRYILPLDADDMIMPNAVKLLADALDHDRRISVAYGNVVFIEENGDLTNYGEQWTKGHSGWPVKFDLEAQLRQLNLLPYCSLFRKEAWANVGGYRRRQRTAEDAELWARLAAYGYRERMVTEADTLIYRNRENSMSRKQGGTNWLSWFTWSRNKSLLPSGADTEQQLPVPSLDPGIISVIIPVGPGHEKYVHDAVDSVEAQTFRNWECIVINDTGKTLPELQAWVKVINPEERYGNVSKARNAGISVSKGRLFLPLDADDYLEPVALEVMYNAYRETKDVIYSDFWQTDSKTGKEFSVHLCDDYDPFLITGGKRQGPDGMMREGMIHSVTALTPKWVWKQIGGYDEEAGGWEDWDFELSMADIGVCERRVAMPLFIYRKHTGYRREQSYSLFEASKKSILQKWGKLWEGGKQLMACGACSRRNSVVPSNSVWFQSTSQAARPPANADEAVKIRYTGSKKGAMPYRGRSGTVYWFGEGDIKWVLKRDLQVFQLRQNEFEVVHDEVAVSNSPSLVAEGPPAVA